MALALVCTSAASAQSSVPPAAALTESRYVDLVLTHSLDARVAESEAALGRAETIGAGALPNPSLSWMREAVPGGAGSSQDTIHASIPLVLSGRLSLTEDAAERRAQAAEARADRARAELHHAAVRAFQAVVEQRERLEVLEASLGQLEQLTQAVEVRERAGAASGYDRLRMELERATLANALRGAQAAERRAAADALRLVGASAPALPALAGPIVRNRPLPRLDVLLAALDGKRADVRAFALEARAASATADAAGRGWIPEPTIHAGVQLVDPGSGLDTGYVVGVTVPLPLFEHGQGEQARAAAARDLAEARRAALLQTARTRLTAAFEDVTQRREQLAQHGSEVLAKTEELRRVASSAYRGGAAELLVLVDAERAARDAQLTALELTSAVAEAENDLLFLSGAYDGPRRRRTAP